jgi:phosphatidylinositol glycan class K
MIDTCQANTMYSKLYSPNIFAVGSADIGENSYSVSRFLNATSYFFLLLKNMQHINDNDIGVAVIDAFTHYVLQFMEKINKTSQVSMQELVKFFGTFPRPRLLNKSFPPLYSSNLSM